MATTAQSAQSKTGTTEQLVQFLVDTDYSHLSEAARERAKELVLDFARAALGGGTSPLGKIVLSSEASSERPLLMLHTPMPSSTMLQS
jgi:2-methylcitrate dehydratase PrpD